MPPLRPLAAALVALAFATPALAIGNHPEEARARRVHNGAGIDCVARDLATGRDYAVAASETVILIMTGFAEFRCMVGEAVATGACRAEADWSDMYLDVSESAALTCDMR